MADSFASLYPPSEAANKVALPSRHCFGAAGAPPHPHFRHAHPGIGGQPLAFAGGRERRRVHFHDHVWHRCGA